MTEETTKKIIDINGVKLEVDLRKAKVISNYKVGDTVKVLLSNYSGYVSYTGIIVGFDNFKSLPTLIISYVDSIYSCAAIKTVYLNAETKDIEIIPASSDELNFDYEIAETMLLRAIETKKQDLETAERAYDYFKNYYGRTFTNIDQQQEENNND